MQSVTAVWEPSLATQTEGEPAETILEMIAALEDDDDVQDVFANFEVSDEVLRKLTAA